MPDWSPVRAYGGYAAWSDAPHAHPHAAERAAASACGCHSACGIHGHNHAHAWTSSVPADDLKSFWGALGCSCWAF
jgi:hypothetical protein